MPHLSRTALLPGISVLGISVLLTHGPAQARLAPLSPAAHPLAIEAMRGRPYPGSAFTTREVLRAGANYSRSVVSYQSEGLRINALLTVPNGAPPGGGWPAIVFNHGYIPPEQYRTTERYVAYLDAFARAGFVVLKPDYRGHGSSQGQPTGAYWSPDYTVDVLNAFSSLQKHPNVNPARVGMWGHSMGGHITLRAMVVNPAIKAGNIWAGVVAPYDVMLEGWRGRNRPPSASRSRRAEILARHGEPVSNPGFYQAISPNFFLKDLARRPLEIHHGTADSDVPLSFAQALVSGLRNAGQPYNFYVYQGDDHNLSRNLGRALQRSVAFFRKNL